MRESITYAEYAAAIRLMLSHTDLYVDGTGGRRWQVAGILSETEFLARGVVTGALVLAQLHPTINLGMAGVLLTGLVDNGRDAQDVMVDVDRANTWWGMVPEPVARRLSRLHARPRTRRHA